MAAPSKLARLRSRGAPPPEGDGERSYFKDTRELVTSALLVLPLFFAYQIGVLVFTGAQNGVDFMTGALFRAIGWVLLQLGTPDASGHVVVTPPEVYRVYVGVNVALLVILAVVVVLLRRRGHLRLRLWPLVIAESSVYAVLFSGAVFTMMHALGLDRLLLVPSLAAAGEPTGMTALVASIGAGLHEELVFRLLLMGGLHAALTRFAKLPPLVAAILAVLASSALFSAVHYLGPAGDPFTMASFLYRLFAGVLLAIIFHVRGFAVAAYTHAIYDVLVLVF